MLNKNSNPSRNSFGPDFQICDTIRATTNSNSTGNQLSMIPALQKTPRPGLGFKVFVSVGFSKLFPVCHGTDEVVEPKKF